MLRVGVNRNSIGHNACEVYFNQRIYNFGLLNYFFLSLAIYVMP